MVLEFDPNKNAVINPSDLVKPRNEMPKVAVTCFAKDTFKRMVEKFGGEKVTVRSLANMDITVYYTYYRK